MQRGRATLTTLAGLALACGGSGIIEPEVVHTEPLDLSGVPAPTLGDGILDELKRSPLWSVSGGVAALRSVTPQGGEPVLVTEWLDQGAPPISQIHNGAIRQGNAVMSLSVKVTSEPPEEPAATLGGSAPLPITAGYADGVPDGYSESTLWVVLGEGLWLQVAEQSPDPHRAATKAAVEGAVAALTRAAAGRGQPARDLYAPFFSAVGGAGTLLRYEGLQSRDTLGAVFVAEAGRRYDGVMVRVFDEAVCGGECTRGWQQERKAEQLGAPPPGDLVFALVEDNAVYLSGEADERYGIFTGSESFEAEIRWTDAGGAPLASERGLFRGWQR